MKVKLVKKNYHQVTKTEKAEIFKKLWIVVDILISPKIFELQNPKNLKQSQHKKYRKLLKNVWKVQKIIKLKQSYLRFEWKLKSSTIVFAPRCFCAQETVWNFSTLEIQRNLTKCLHPNIGIIVDLTKKAVGNKFAVNITGLNPSPVSGLPDW